MKTIVLAPKEHCTACGVCTQVCPKACIQMKADAMDCAYPVINQELCIECGRCQSACPALQPSVYMQSVQQVYAAWNTKEPLRMAAASGGVATAIYTYALAQGIKSFGVHLKPEGTACYMEVSSAQDVEACRNSKYVYSDISPVLKNIKNYLDQGHRVILPALPCQIAAVLAFLGGRRENLILIDIVCHGVCPPEYLQQHIATIERKKCRKADAVSFRDPAYGTQNFIFTLRSKENVLYKAKVKAADPYQLGYHSALNYRQNCYHCQYATAQRLGDLTISDFSGLGRLAPFSERRQSVSCVMINTEAGRQLLTTLMENGDVAAQERPVREALDYEKQLRAPSVPHGNRQVFAHAYMQSRNYDQAAREALKKDITINRVRNALQIERLKRLAAKLVPKTIKQKIKKAMKKHGR